MNRLFSYIMFLISAVSAQAQVTLLAKPDIRDLQVDQRLTLTVVLELQGNDFNIQSTLKMPDFSKFEQIGNASESRTDLITRTKTIVYQFVLQPKQTGRIKVGSILYDANDKIYKTEPFDIFVTEADIKKSVAKVDDDDLMYLNLEVKDRSIYKNQPTIAVLKAYSKNFDNFRKVKKVKSPTNSRVNFRQIDFKKSDIEQNNNSKMASQVIAVFIVTTPESGRVEIPAISAVLGNNSEHLTLKSNKVNINVKKLPVNSPKNYKNAVGKYAVDLTCDAKEINMVGQPITANIKVSGEGNLRSMTLPKLAQSDDYSFFKPKIIYHTKSSDNGTKGDINLEYVVIPKKAGKITLTTEHFSFFDPETNKYQDLKSDTLSFQTLTEVQIDESKSTLDKVNDYTSNVLQTVKTPKIIQDHLGITEKPELNYKIILTNLVLFSGLVFFIFRYRKKKREQHKLKKSAQFFNNASSENVTETEIKIKNASTPDLDTELKYLEKLKSTQDFSGYFRSIDKLNIELENYAQFKAQTNLNTYLISIKGNKFAEDFRNLNEEINMERFSPFHTLENIDALHFKISNLYLEIT